MNGAEATTLDLSVNPAVFFEETHYWVVVESRVTGVVPIVLQRDPGLVSRTDEIAGHGILALTMVYRRQVGMSKWRFEVGEEYLEIEIEVFPSKLDYDVDYEALVADVAEVKRALAFEYFRGTYRLGRIDRSGRGEALEWITILRSMIDGLRRAIQQVNRLPHRALQYNRDLAPLGRVRGSRPSVVRAVTRREGFGELVEVPGVGKVHSWLPTEIASDTLDTLEHRWLRSRLRFVHARLLALCLEQDARLARAHARGASPTRLRLEREEIFDMVGVIDSLLQLPVIEAATTDVPASFSSLQLQTAVGYGDAYRILTALGAALGLDSENQPYSVADVSELYEIWCFLKVVQVAAEATGAQLDLSQVLATSKSGLRFNLIRGSRSAVAIRWASGSLTLVYNEEHRMPTGIQRPDIVLHLQLEGHAEQVIALDAKYRLDSSPEYVRQFRSPGAPTDAVNALHRYRDAIRPQVDGRRVPVVIAGVALFPWQAPLPAHEYDLRRSLDEVGIGAIPFLPGNEAGLTEWLDELFKPTPTTPRI